MTATAGLIPDEYRAGPSLAEWQAAWESAVQDRINRILERPEVQEAIKR